MLGSRLYKFQCFHPDLHQPVRTLSISDSTIRRLSCRSASRKLDSCFPDIHCRNNSTCGKALSAACRISHTLIFQQCTHCRNHAMTFVISATCGKALSAACRTSIHLFFSNALIAEITLKEAGYNTLSREVQSSHSRLLSPSARRNSFKIFCNQPNADGVNSCNVLQDLCISRVLT